ncbi:MAG: hypothetical protein R3C58_13955 [Parvularculaceae bacterium]
MQKTTRGAWRRAYAARGESATLTEQWRIFSTCCRAPARILEAYGVASLDGFGDFSRVECGALRRAHRLCDADSPGACPRSIRRAAPP